MLGCVRAENGSWEEDEVTVGSLAQHPEAFYLGRSHEGVERRVEDFGGSFRIKP